VIDGEFVARLLVGDLRLTPRVVPIDALGHGLGLGAEQVRRVLARYLELAGLALRIAT